VTNWAAYDASLRQRGSLTVWFSEEAIVGWRAEGRTTPGGQPHYSALAILTGLCLRAAFRLALRQTEGLIGSIIGLLGLDLAIPDHTTLCRQADGLDVPRPQSSPCAGAMHLIVDSTGLKFHGPGEWLVEKHGTRTRRHCQLDLERTWREPCDGSGVLVAMLERQCRSPWPRSGRPGRGRLDTGRREGDRGGDGKGC